MNSEFAERVDAAIAAAGRYADEGPMASSAHVALEDAVSLRDNGDLASALRRARASLGYSVGAFHPAYIDASRDLVEA